MSRIKGKVALITGGVSGIGYHYAKSLIANGIKGLILADINEEVGNEAICELKECGEGELRFIKTDVTVPQQLKNAFDAAAQNFGQFDIAINNLGVLQECTWENMVKVNYVAVVRGVQMAMKNYLPKYRSGEESIIVNTSSVVGIQPLQCAPINSATKHAVRGLGKAFGTDYYYGKYQTRIITICPGLTFTPMIATENLQGIDIELKDEEIRNWKFQKPEECGKCLIKAINDGENGSIWVTEGNEIYEYIFPDRFEVRKEMERNESKK